MPSLMFSRKFPGAWMSQSYHTGTALWPWFLEARLTSQAISAAYIHLETWGSPALAALWLPEILTAKLGNIFWLKVLGHDKKEQCLLSLTSTVMEILLKIK